MTINYILEGILGKESLLSGDPSPDATPFSENSVDIAETLATNLAKHGFNRSGTEVMYSGFTGKPLVAEILFCSVYYQRLKHLVVEKQHSRSYGPMQQLSHQPVAGRLNFGLSECTTILIIIRM